MSTERTLSLQETPATGGGIGTIFDASPAVAMATVSSGIHVARLPVGNLTVGEIRARFRDRFQIGPDSEARLNGEPVGDDVIVRDGQSLRFLHAAGEKGQLA